MRHLIDHLAHALPDLARWLAEDKLPGLLVSLGVQWWTGGGGS